MSVAFRRESDEEHREPTFELPIPSGPNLVTTRGLGLIEARIVALETAIGEAGEEPAKPLRRELRYWQTRRATAIETAPRDDSTAGFGSRVTFLLDGRQRTVTIVGDDEADPVAGLLALSAPLARALLGCEAGDLAPFNGSEDAIEVVAVA